MSGGEILVDDTENTSSSFDKGAGANFTGVCDGNCNGWASISGGLGNRMFDTTADGGAQVTQWARWKPSISADGGIYDVYVHVPDTSGASWQAPYVIKHFSGTSAGMVDQKELNNQWASIGIYRMSSTNYVWTHDASRENTNLHCPGAYCRLRVDAVKFVRRGTIYLPDMRYNNSGWSSRLVLRNNGGGTAQALIKYYKADGTVVCVASATMNAHHSLSVSCTDSNVATAVVESDQDLSAVVLQERISLLSPPYYTLDAYVGVATARTTVHIPIVQKGNSGWYSDLFLHNPNAQNATATLTFTPAPGTNNGVAWSNTYGIGANGMLRLYTSGIGELGSRFVGSVQVSADQPLAVAATQYNSASQLMAWSSTQPLAATLYGPLIQNNNSGWLSGLTLRAPGGNLPVSAAYRVSNTGGGCASETWWNNPQIVYPAPQGNPPGCGATPNAVFTAGGELAATVNQLQGTLNATTYEAIAAPAQSASIPKVQRDAYWNDGFVVMNVNTTAVNVTVRLYNSNGALNSTPFNNHPLGANQSLIVLGQIPYGFDGSALVTADQPVAVIANAWRPGSGSGDVIGSYPASHR